MDKKKAVYVPTVGEEIGNAVSHGVMSLLSLLALPFAAVWAYAHDPGGVLASVSVSVFVISIFLMFLASTLYHSMNPQSKHKEVFHILDHIFIYVAIAGSYTPIALSVIGVIGIGVCSGAVAQKAQHPDNFVDARLRHATETCILGFFHFVTSYCFLHNPRELRTRPASSQKTEFQCGDCAILFISIYAIASVAVPGRAIKAVLYQPCIAITDAVATS